jgi:hypothetical protein
MKRFSWILLAITITFPSINAFGVSRIHDFGLVQKSSVCDGLGTYTVEATWNPIEGVQTYAFASGNHCQLKGVVCGTKGGCGTVTCAGPGLCKATLTSCQIGRGGAWIRVFDGVGVRYQNLGTRAPSYCR